MVQEAVIRPVQFEPDLLPNPFGYIRKTKQRDAGNDAGSDTPKVRANSGTGNEERAYWYCIHYCLPDKVKHMTGAEVKDWAICNGYKIDGQVNREWVNG